MHFFQYLPLYRSDKKYLVWKTAQIIPVGQKSRIWLRQVEENGIYFVPNSVPISLLEANDAYDWFIVEGPSLIWNSELGYYYLIFSANYYGNQHYHVGVARSQKVREKNFLFFSTSIYFFIHTLVKTLNKIK